MDFITQMNRVITRQIEVLDSVVSNFMIKEHCASADAVRKELEILREKRLELNEAYIDDIRDICRGFTQVLTNDLDS